MKPLLGGLLLLTAGPALMTISKRAAKANMNVARMRRRVAHDGFGMPVRILNESSQGLVGLPMSKSGRMKMFLEMIAQEDFVDGTGRDQCVDEHPSRQPVGLFRVGSDHVVALVFLATSSHR